MPPEFRLEAIEEHRSFLRALARELLADEHAAEDVVQEASIAWWSSPPRSAEAARAWLARVTRNLALNHRRERERRDAREEFAARGEAVPSEAEIDAGLETQRRVLAAVLALREPYKSVVWLRWYEGLPPRAIARRTGRTVETVKSQQKRALAELRAALDADFGDRRAWSVALLPLLRRASSPSFAASALVAGCFLCALAVSIVLLARPDRPSPTLANAALLGASALPDGLGADLAEHPAELALDAPPARVPAASGSAFRGRAIDAHDGASLPELDIVVRCDDGTSAPARTGLDGAFEVRLAPGARVADVAFLEGELVTIARERVDEVGVPEFALAIGPTFALELARAPAAPEELLATLALPGARERGVPARVRAGPRPLRPWVRFPRAPELSLLGAGERSMYVLGVASADGLARALARVHARDGTHKKVVPLTFELCGSVRGRIAAPAWATKLGASATLVSAADRSERRTEVAEDGTFELALVPPGPARLVLCSSVLADAELDVQVASGASTEVEYALGERPRTLGSITLESSSGLHELPGRPRFRRKGVTEWRDAIEHGGVTAPDRMRLVSFRAEPGEYEVVPPACDDYAWEPAIATVRVPDGHASFRLLDTAPTERVELRATTTDGAPIARFRASVLIDRLELGRRAAVELDGAGLVRDGRRGVAVFERVPRAASGWWLVEADGFQSAWGELDELDRRGNERSTTVELVPAWICAFEFVGRDADGREHPLRGVRVSSKGGRLLATSLGDGRAELELLYDPGALALELDGWRLTSWDGFSGGKRRAVLVVHRVELEPAVGR